jgi:hypothetical protein
VHFFDAWSELPPFDLVRLLAPLGFLALGTLLPGGRVARVAALGVAAGVPFLRELAAPYWVVAGWTVLWVFVGWRSGSDRESAPRPLSATRSVLESGTVGLLLGLLLVALLLAAVARQDMSPEDGRRASYGAALLGLGLLHLMLRRHLRRSALGFAGLGLGLQVLNGAARGAEVQGMTSGGGGVLLATVFSIALATRIAGGRERHAGTAWVGDAHDLHD